MNKATNVSTADNQTVLVVPVQAGPVTVVSHHLGVSAALGILGTAAEQAAAGSAREQLAARLNRDAKDFKPERILAEECSRLLKTSSSPAFRNAILQEESVLQMKERELLKSETLPFKGRNTNMMEWLSLYNEWRKGPPVAVSRHQADGSRARLSLEVRFQWIEINHGNKLDTAALVRLVDHSSQKVVGAQYVAHEFSEIRPVTMDSDVAAFKEDFRNLAGQVAKEALTKMKLL